jgi:2-dehydro-3-deoxygalactonokinase
MLSYRRRASSAFFRLFWLLWQGRTCLTGCSLPMQVWRGKWADVEGASRSGTNWEAAFLITLLYHAQRLEKAAVMTNTFLSCDWGTSQFRLRLASRPGCEVLGEFRSSEGVGRLAAASTSTDRAENFRRALTTGMIAFEKQLSNMASDCPVVISGMASSSIGWTELPYATLPFALDGSDMVWQEVDTLQAKGNLHRVILLSGVRTEWEMMRGEETQLLGLAGLTAGGVMADEAVVILPGTHSKHVHVKGARIIDFATYMTGELFEVLSRHSLLQHSVSTPEWNSPQASRLEGPAQVGFQEGIEAIRSAPLLQQLFRVRTRQVLHGRDPAENRGFLSGLLIGTEITGLTRSYPGSTPLVLCGGAMLNDLYEIACQALGLRDRLQIVPGPDGERLSVLGQAIMLSRIMP